MITLWHSLARCAVADVARLNEETATFHVSTTDPTFGSSSGTTPLVLNRPMVYSSVRSICEVSLGAWSTPLQPIPPLIVTMGGVDDSDPTASAAGTGRSTDIDEAAAAAMAALDALNAKARDPKSQISADAVRKARDLAAATAEASSVAAVFRHRVSSAQAVTNPQPRGRDSDEDGPQVPWATSLPFTVHHKCLKTGRVIVRVYLKVNRFSNGAGGSSAVPGSAGDAGAGPISVVVSRSKSGKQQSAKTESKLYHFQYTHDCKVAGDDASGSAQTTPASPDGRASTAIAIVPDTPAPAKDDTAAALAAVPLNIGSSELLTDVVQHGVTAALYTVPPTAESNTVDPAKPPAALEDSDTPIIISHDKV